VTALDSAELRPFSAVFITACAWAVVLAGIPAAVVLALGARGDARAYWIPIGTVAALGFAWVVYRVRLEIDYEEIRVFNVRKTHRIPWASVSRIDVVAWWLSPSVIVVGNAAVRVSTKSGETIVIDASGSAASRVLDALARFSRKDVEIQPG
jgi:hypothetical protein